MKTISFVSVLVWTRLITTCPADPLAEYFAGDLQSQDAAVRRAAAVSIGRLGRPAAVPALIRALDDPEQSVRREAAKALGSIKDARAVAALLEAIRDADRNVRFYAAYALGEIKDPQAIDALVGSLRDPEWTVRDQAAWALREIGDPRMIGPLVGLLKEKSADVPHIVWVLRQAGADEASKHLAELLEDPDVAVRMRALRILGEFEDAAAVVPLMAALRDSDSEVRRRAVQALAKYRDDRVVKSLKELAARETDPTIRQAAEKAASELSRHEALAAYWSFDDGDLRVAKDVTGRGSDGAIHGCTSVEGKIGHGLRFGEGAYIELGKPGALPIANTPLTVAAWIKSDAPNGVVVARGGAFCGLSLYLKDGLPKFAIRHVEEGPLYVAAGKEQVAGRWTHLAGVIKNDRIELYVNGKLAATDSRAGYMPSNAGQGMQIGFDVGNSPAEIVDHFQGIIDEVKVFHAALSEAEIAREGQLEPL